MINTENSIILIIDIQEKLIKMLEKDTISSKAEKLIRVANVFKMPHIITEQYPKGLGSTLEGLKQETTDKTIFFEKTSFSAFQEDGFKNMLSSFKRKKILVCGIETHICVYQTVIDLIAEDYEVEVIKDVTVSRKEFEFNIGIEKMKQLGVKITSFEMVLFELLKTSKHPNFKELQTLIK